MSIKFTFANTNNSASASGVRVYRSTSTFTSGSLPAVKAELPVDAVEYIDSTAVLGTDYYYMFQLWRNDGTGEESIFTAIIHKRAVQESGAGVEVPTAGDTWYGYFGEITAANFISGSALATALGLSAGTLINDTTNWLKFAYRNKYLFVPKLPIRHSVSKNQLATANAVDGSHTVTIGGKTYKVRLLQGACVDPAPAAVAPVADPMQAHGSEWNDLLYPLFSTVIPSRIVDVAWGSNAIAALGVYRQWTLESVAGGNGVIRGNATTLDTYASVATSTTATDLAWRPCLEFTE